MDIDRLISDFNESAEKSKSKLENVIDLISSGRIPSVLDRTELNSSIEELCELYNKVCCSVSNELTNEELPEAGSSVSTYYDAYQSSRTLHLKEQIIEAKSILSKFISVRSLIDSLSSALEPFQNSATTLLNRINDDEFENIESLINGVSGPKVFLEALSSEDLNSDEGNSLLDSLEQDYSYPSRITRGLSSKSYYIPDSIEYEHINNSSDDKETELISEPLKDNQREVIADDVKEENVVSITVDVPGNVAEDDYEETPFVLSLREADAVLDMKKYGVLSSEISSAESKKITSSVFTNDLRKGSVKAIKDIVQQLDKFPLISSELLTIRYPMPFDVAENSLYFLIKKGYLRKYKVTPGGEFYCASPRLDRALEFKDASRSVGVKQRNHDQREELLEDLVSSAATRVAFLKLFTISVNNYKLHHDSFISQNAIFSEAFIYKSYADSFSDECEMLAGAFWTEYKECEDFLKEFQERIDDGSRISRFVFAAVNLRQASDLLKCIFENIQGAIAKECVFIYSLSNNTFYNYNNQEVSRSEIWKISDSTEHSDEIVHDDYPESESLGDEESEVGDAFNSDPVIIVPDQEVAPQFDLNHSDLRENYGEDELNIFRFLAEGKFYCASSYAKAISAKNIDFSGCYDLIAYALNDPMKHCTYSSDIVFDMVPDNSDYFSEALMVAVGIRTFFSNQVRYDYNIKSLFEAIKSYPIICDNPSLSNVLYTLVEFKSEQKMGMDFYADYHAKSIAQLDADLRIIQNEAKQFHETQIMGKKAEKASQRRFLETKKLMFAPDGDIGTYIEIVANNDTEKQQDLNDFLLTNFIRPDNRLLEDNIDSDLLWEYINVFWEMAGKKMMYRFRADLMSHLRNNIINITTKAVQIMIRWSNLIDKSKGRSEDDSSIAYKKIKNPLLGDIEDAITCLNISDSEESPNIERKAGNAVLVYVLDGLSKCIDGTYDETDKKYFYVPFLLTDDMLLGEGYSPDLDTRFAEIDKLSPERRILDHFNRICESTIDPEDRLKEILNDGGDDYGSARLLIEYMRDQCPDILLDGYIKNISEGEEYAKETADLRKAQFTGDLELAYVSGQIDISSSGEDYKEQILNSVDAWYEYACDSSNYGFFAKVMSSFLEEIRKEAKSREKDLLAQLEKMKSTSFDGVSTDVKERRVKKIQSAIDAQNYTVAEDLLGKASSPDGDFDSVIDEHFLDDFLLNYNDYYKLVSKNQTSLSLLIQNRREHNKEERGGRKLAENWLPGGSDLTEKRLIALLSGLGFRVNQDSVNKQNPIGKYENYIVKTIAPQNGKRENYTHPIAAFGSGASQEGFRIVCVNGNYDAAKLIDIMKQIGNAKHTMILLNFALDIPERRILARRSKTELGDKLFVVIDRTVMMYLIKNYDETRVNRMLMSLIVPFGFYQPYVWESVNVMPPEIFMGRKIELESIESPTGANIVYGGRQLGKSALLKKAKADIDRDENGNRAVLIDIKHLNYEEAARKIGHELYDEGILAEDCDTDDWDILSRVIKKRLMSEDARIPYLLLLLDEADAFIESCESINYRPFDSLKEIQNLGVGRFKFVIAGLRDIVRFNRDVALGNNSVLPHLDVVTVKPFRTYEARELMEVPLHYLGLEFPKENESLLTLIMASTNYFPGLIQMYCAKLLSAMRNSDYAGYDEADTPVYEISEEHIKKVLADPEFMAQIKEKFIITLKLDEDNYYFIIALLMAYLCHTGGYNEGYTSTDIKICGKSLNIKKISNLSDEKIVALMEELKELNVLRHTDSTRYLFARFSFFQIMGTISDVEDQLLDYMED